MAPPPHSARRQLRRHVGAGFKLHSRQMSIMRLAEMFTHSVSRSQRAPQRTASLNVRKAKKTVEEAALAAASDGYVIAVRRRRTGDCSCA